MSYKVLASFLIIFLLPGACREKRAEFGNFTGFTQGTTYSTVFENPGKFKPEELKISVEKILHDFDMSLSIYNDSSIISRINRNEEIAPDSFFTEVFNKSKTISEITDGAFDITVGPLVRAWGFGPDAHKNFDESKLENLMKLIGFDKVTLTDGHVVKAHPGITLDVNAIAQGYSVDVVCRHFDGLGIENYLVEIGGEVRAKGDKNGTRWKIGIDKPVDDNFSPGNNLQAIIKIKDRALATSGNYRKFYIENGIKYSHTIDPRTGYPVKNKLLSATILADECATADALATACMVMGKDGTIAFLSKHKDMDAYLVFSDDNGNFKTWASKKIKKFISEIENE